MRVYNCKFIRIIYIFGCVYLVFFLSKKVQNHELLIALISLFLFSAGMWWLLASHLFYLRFNEESGIILKLGYYRRINLRDIRKATYELEHVKWQFFLGQTFIMILRKKKGRTIRVPFAKEKDFEYFKKVIEERSKLKVTRESDYLLNRRRAKRRKISDNQ